MSMNHGFSRREVFKIEDTKLNIQGCLTMHLPHEIKWNANLMQLGNFIDVFLARRVSGT